MRVVYTSLSARLLFQNGAPFKKLRKNKNKKTKQGKADDQSIREPLGVYYLPLSETPGSSLYREGLRKGELFRGQVSAAAFSVCHFSIMAATPQLRCKPAAILAKHPAHIDMLNSRTAQLVFPLRLRSVSLINSGFSFFFFPFYIIHYLYTKEPEYDIKGSPFDSLSFLPVAGRVQRVRVGDPRNVRSMKL